MIEIMIDTALVTKVASAAGQQTLNRLADAPRDDGFPEIVRNAFIDISADQVATYKLTVLAAKDTESVEEVAALWEETAAFLQGSLDLWNAMADLGLDPLTTWLLEYHRSFTRKLFLLAQGSAKFHGE